MRIRNLKLLATIALALSISSGIGLSVEAKGNDQKKIIQRDSVMPELVSVDVDKKTCKEGEKIKLSVKASDDESGVQSVVAYYTVGNSTSTEIINLKLDLETNLYTAEITAKEAFRDIEITTLIIQDNNNNEKNAYLDETIKIQVTDKNGNIDKESPKFINFNMDNKSPKVGDVVTFSIDARDDASGVEIVNLTIMKGNEEEAEDISLVYNDKTKKYEAKMEIVEDFLGKHIEVWSCTIIDKVGKQTNEWINEKLIVRSGNGEVDNIAPTIGDVYLEKNQASNGERVKVRVKANDNQSGISTVKVHFGNTQATDSVDLAYNNETKLYEGDIYIQKVFKNSIEINSIEAIDVSGNYYNKYFDFEELDPVTIKINHREIDDDSEAPVYKGITFNKNSVEAGGAVTISVKAQDENSGVKSILLEYILQGKNHRREMKYDKKTNSYMYTIKVPENSKYEYIEIKNIGMLDYANNFTTKTLMENNIISIENEEGKVDITNPTIGDVRVNTNIINVGDRLKIEAELNDDMSGVCKATYSYWTDVESGSIDLVYNKEKKKFEGFLDITEEMQGQKIWFDRVRVEDFAGNFTVLSKQNKVLVKNKNGVATSQEPVIKDISLSKNLAPVGDTVKISVDLEHDAEIRDIEYQYHIFGLGHRNAILTYNPVTKKYEGEIKILKIFEGKELDFKMVTAIDTFGNVGRSYGIHGKSLDVLVSDKKTGWIELDGKDYYYENGIMQTNKWIGSYYVGNNGAMQTSRWIGDYYVDGSGKYVKNKWVGSYYCGSNGKYVKNKWVGDYYVDGTGKYVKNKWVGSYYCGSNGKYVKNKWVGDYYVDGSGKYVKSKWVGDYYVDGTGKYVKNKWVGSYYTGSNGKYVKNKWVKTNNKWYYCDGSGKYLKSTSKKIGNKTYKFNSSGVCLNP